ncbi:retrovirus-related Pol polyprotein from transposon 412 [Trichonephila clavipes]|uniref:Retrovirus-related Pol polyprotein from transposon 412 n=1 Tax=Trichonephila clavipes TaxID=2585209 RepID=A0A8X6SRY3_TRICX|nr:retrovirus-related Pol polyprotein from transposon 412 [Trichonephila clavipes]
MVVDQLKKRANASMKDHFLDNWANLKSATQIAELFDNYEDVREEVFTKVNIDACGPLPITSKGNRYLITAICMSSKFPEAIPVSDISSVIVTDALLNIFSRMGFPREIQCEQGTSFTSALTTEFFERFGILARHSSVYHPQSNPVERFHRTLKRFLRVLCLDAGSECDKHLSSIVLALRTVSHESTGYTPSELVYMGKICEPQRQSTGTLYGTGRRK